MIFIQLEKTIEIQNVSFLVESSRRHSCINWNTKKDVKKSTKTNGCISWSSELSLRQLFWGRTVTSHKTYSEQIKKDSVPRCLILYELKKTKNYLILSREIILCFNSEFISKTPITIWLSSVNVMYLK